jgi:hypothetical protein
MYTRLNLHCTYQKNMFPGLIYRPHASPVVLLCFFSGKIVITGGRTERDVTEGWRRLWPTIRVFVRSAATSMQAIMLSDEAGDRDGEDQTNEVEEGDDDRHDDGGDQTNEVEEGDNDRHYDPENDEAEDDDRHYDPENDEAEDGDDDDNSGKSPNADEDTKDFKGEPRKKRKRCDENI